MPPKSARVKPTPYPPLPFHALRAAQLGAALVVASITAYFLRELAEDNYPLPWTFILLLAVSVLTALALASTITLHFRSGLQPTLNLALNAALGVSWAVAFALLAWWSAPTLASACGAAGWDSALGQSVCRTYKALFGFALLGMLATLAAAALDVRVRRRGERRGRFRSLAMRGGDADGSARGLGAGGDGDADVGGWDVNPNPVARGARRPGVDGYGLPEEQFGYADTAYAGAAGEMGRRSGEGRL